MARTNKTTNSNQADDHLGREETLRKDSIAQTLGHTNEIRAKKGLPPLVISDPVIAPRSDDEANNQTLDDGGDLELVQNAGLIVGLRAYAGGAGAPVSEDEFVAIHRRVRRERVRYRELNGMMVEVGDSLPRPDKSRQKKTRPVPGVLKSMMVRLMPTEAEGAGEMNVQNVEAALDETVAEFERATGCEVITAAVHRMSVTDLHVHIQYTMVQAVQESKHMLGRRLKQWKLEASKKARESLDAEGTRNHSPAQIGARKKRLIAEGLLSAPPQAGIEYQKIPGKRSLGDGAILGYSFRQKLNLVRAAERGGEKELAEQVARRNDERWGRFMPIANRSDEEVDAKYLDLWLERAWRRNVTSKLPKEQCDRLLVAGVQAARDYATYGTSVAEETHIRRRLKELEEKNKELEARVKEIGEARRAAEHDRVQAQMLAFEKRKLQGQVTSQADQIARLQQSVRQATDTAAGLQDRAGRIRAWLKPAPEEDLVEAAKRVAGAAEKPELLQQLAVSQKKVGELKEELNLLHRAVVTFLEAVKKARPKLGADLIAMLQGIAELLGVKFRLSDKKKEDQQPEIN